MRKHLGIVAVLLMATMLGMYVIKSTHAWQIKQAIAHGDCSHHGEDCPICQFAPWPCWAASSHHLTVFQSYNTDKPLLYTASCVSPFRATQEGRGPPYPLIIP